MTIYNNDHVEIKYSPTSDNNSYLRNIHCCNITKNHIPFHLYIRTSRIETTTPNMSNVLSQVPTFKELWVIDFEKYHFTFTQLEVALQYFEMFSYFDENKIIQELLPELFL